MPVVDPGAPNAVSYEGLKSVFTGIVEELGTITAVAHRPDSALLTVRGSTVLADLDPGSSISVDGVCLTAVDITPSTFTADVMQQTLKHSTLFSAVPGRSVNLERPLKADGRLGGHIVAGHVDATTKVRARQHSPQWDVLTFDLPPALSRYFIKQGSITVDGVSLTVSDLDDGAGVFSVSLIPTTLSTTTLGTRAVGDLVNLEVDLVGKYIERLTMAKTPVTS